MVKPQLRAGDFAQRILNLEEYVISATRGIVVIRSMSSPDAAVLLIQRITLDLPDLNMYTFISPKCGHCTAQEIALAKTKPYVDRALKRKLEKFVLEIFAAINEAMPQLSPSVFPLPRAEDSSTHVYAIVPS